MALPSRTRAALALALVALAFFALGVLAAGRLGAPGQPDARDAALPVASGMPAPPPPVDAGPPEPRLALDPDSVELLPDASLHLELPPGFDGGSADGSGAR
jgi:hypothetical protein